MWALAWTAFLMGLLGGAHCLVMCSAPCGALLARGGKESAREQPVRFVRRQRLPWQSILFHGGRVAGYAALGALAAYAMDRLAWFSQGTTALRPIWTAMHIAIIAWGLMLVMRLQAPAWMERAGRGVWSRVKSAVDRPGGVLAVGCGWALMPCGFLYSAAMLAALSGGPLAGALAMSMFALASGLWLWTGHWGWLHFRERLRTPRMAAWGVRLSGIVLVALGATALWWGVVHQQQAPWCVT